MIPVAPKRRVILATSVASLIAVNTTLKADETFTGTTSSDWNTASNWDGGHVPNNEAAIINTSTGNIATISSSITGTPYDIFVGLFSASARLDQVAGTAQNQGGAWMYIGRGGGNNVFNLANTAATGGTLTGYGTGSGTMNVTGNLQIGDPFANSGGTQTVNVNTTGALNVSFDLNVGQGGATGILNVDAGAVTANNLHVGTGGNGGTGTVNQSGGSMTTNSILSVGDSSGMTGNYNLTGGTVTSNDQIWVGESGTGVFTQSGGTSTSVNYLVVGRSATGNGTLNLTGGTINAATSGGLISIGSIAGSNGTINVSGGTLHAYHQIYVGEGWTGSGTATGTLNVSGGGLVQVDDTVEGLRLGVQNGSDNSGAHMGSGTVNLNGGTLRTPIITQGGGTGTFNFNGGTLQAGQSTASYMTGLTRANVRDGGAVIDSNGYDITVAQVLSHSNIGGDNATDGGLTKNGSGSLNLTGANTYTGNTTLNAGTLFAGNTSAFGTGSINLVGGTLTNSAGGFFSVGNSLVAATGGSVNIRGATGSLFQLSGNLTGSGSIDAAAVYNGSGLRFGGDNSGYTGTFTVSGANVRIGLNSGSASAKFVVNGGLQFDDGSGTFNLGSLSGTGEVGSHATGVTQIVSVGALNTSTTFGGRITNIISSTNGNDDGNTNSTVGLTKVGTGTLTLSGANDYTGATTVNGGRLLVNGSTANSTVTVNNSGSLLGGSGTVGGPVIIDSGAILQGGATATGQTLTLTANSLTLNTNSIIELILGGSGAHSTIAYTSGGFNGFQGSQAFTLDNIQAGSYDNIFTGVASGINTSGWTVTNGSGYTYSFTDDGFNIDLNVTAVPEPATWMAGAGCLAVLAESLRRRQLLSWLRLKRLA